MKISCFHCSKVFEITADLLGGQAVCPHCQNEVQLPKSNAPAGEEEDPDAGKKRPLRLWENSVSTLVSLVIHMLLVIVLAMIGYNRYSGEGLGEDVLIGELPSETLSPDQNEEFDASEQIEKQADMQETEEMLEVDPAATRSESDAVSEEQFMVKSPSAGGDSASFDLGTITSGGGSMAGGSWDGLLQNLRRNGLDIVIAFDSTGSMGGEIRQVKGQIGRIGSTLLRLVPKARISICTYRDVGDDYVVKGLPLTNEMSRIDGFLTNTFADGGGDHPEAVHEGLGWAAEKNQFRPRARKVILLFGDAPPHPQFLGECLRTASDFNRTHKGIVSTVTCRKRVRIKEFDDIAQAGGGESFLTTDERQIMTKLMVLVFGSRYKAKVLEAFKMLER